MGILLFAMTMKKNSKGRPKGGNRMGMPFSKINIGDVFESPLKWTGSDIVYTVTEKADGLIKIRSSYQHHSLSETMWKKPSDRIFNKHAHLLISLKNKGRP